MGDLQIEFNAVWITAHVVKGSTAELEDFMRDALTKEGKGIIH